MATRAVVRDRADRARSARPGTAEADRDLVGMYLDEIARTPLLDAAQEVELSLRIEAGVFAQHLLDEYEAGGALPEGATEEELRAIVADGERAKDVFIRS